MKTVLLLLLATVPQARTKGSCSEAPDAIWCEEFNDRDSRPNPRHWNYDLGTNGGWGNNESQNYTEENVFVEDGFLRIQATRDGNVFQSARIRTQDKVSFRYVRLEARIQIPDLTGGLWPAFWTLGDNFANVSWPFCGEIDIAEWGSSTAIQDDELHTQVLSALHWEDDGHIYENDALSLDTALHEGFHTYALDWTPNTISMYVDNQLVFTKKVSDLKEFQEPHFVILNVAVGGFFTGIEFPSSVGGEMLVDWIRAYDNGYDSNISVAPCPECPDGSTHVGHELWLWLQIGCVFWVLL